MSCPFVQSSETVTLPWMNDNVLIHKLVHPYVSYSEKFSRKRHSEFVETTIFAEITFTDCSHLPPKDGMLPNLAETTYRNILQNIKILLPSIKKYYRRTDNLVPKSVYRQHINVVQILYVFLYTP